MSRRTMKSRNKITILTSIVILFFVVIGCESGPPKIRNVIVSNQKEAKEKKVNFEAKDTIYVKVEVENNFEDMKVKSNMTLEQDVYDRKKGEVFPGTEGTNDFGTDIEYLTLEFSYDGGFPTGKYKINLELLDKEGNKVDSKSVEVSAKGSDDSEEKSAYSPPIGNGGD